MGESDPRIGVDHIHGCSFEVWILLVVGQIHRCFFEVWILFGGAVTSADVLMKGGWILLRFGRIHRCHLELWIPLGVCLIHTLSFIL